MADGIRVRILKGNRPNLVRMPSGREIKVGGVCLQQALKNGGVILDKPLEVENGYDEGSVIVLDPDYAHALIERGEAEIVQE